MSYEAPHFDDGPDDAEHLLPQPGDRPFIKVEMGGEPYCLTYDNTLVRKFSVGDGKFDHFINHISDENAFFAFFDDIEIGDFLRDYFEKEEFRTLHCRFLDERTIDWYSQTKGVQLDYEISEFLSE